MRFAPRTPCRIVKTRKATKVENEKRLQELYNKGKQSNFRLPPEITVERTSSADGCYVQNFFHQTLGELGRIIIIPRGLESQICCEVIGDPDDSITKKKKDIFSPIAEQITAILEKELGIGLQNVAPYSLNEGGDIIESKVFPCNNCNQVVAMMISAHDAQTQGDLENYASKMYSKVTELNVPTWVVGREREITLPNARKTGEAILIKIWPGRENPEIIEADLFNEMIDKLMNNHCRNRKLH